MFIVTLINNGIETEIHGSIEKLRSGKVVKGINAIDTFSFSMLPSNAGFGLINDFITLVKVYNTNKDRYEFFGRVLYSDTSMDESGLITKDVTCESYFGFFCDTQQTVVGEKNWTVSELVQYIIDSHNEQIEDYKKFTIGEVTVTDPDDNVYIGIQYANTWDTIKEKLLDKLGGEIRFRVEDGVNYFDYLTQIGKTSETKITISRNMKSIKQEKDPSAYITRLIPLGMRMGENDERLTIEEVNDGVKYIDDTEAIALYGIHVGYVEWDDVTEAANLLTKGQEWLTENNKLQVKYSVTALDLSLLELDIDDFEVCNYHAIENPLLGIDDVARIIKKNIDVCEEIKSTIEIGDSFKSFSDIQISQATESKKVYSEIKKTTEKIELKVENEVTEALSQVEVSQNEIIARVEANENNISTLTQTAEDITTRVEDAEGNISEVEQTVDGITMSVSQATGTDGKVYSTIQLKVGEKMYTGQILMEGNLNVSGQLSADALYAAQGNVADLIVDKLSTSRRIKKYLAGDTTDDNYIHAEGECLQFISGVVAEGEDTEQATTPSGVPIYWESDPDASGVVLGEDGYPYLDGIRIFTTTTETDWPVMCYVYDELVKGSLQFEMDDYIHVPTLTLGGGDGKGNNIFRMLKGLEGLHMLYADADGDTIGIKMTSDGYLDLIGARKTTKLDFSGWDSGSFVETIDGAITESYDVELDASGRPVSITDSAGHKTEVVW